MASLDGLENRVERLEARLDGRISSGAEFTTLARSTSAGDKDQADVAGSSEGSSRDNQRPVLRTSPWGISGRPVAGVFVGLVKAIGQAFGGLIFGQWTDKYGPGTGALPELAEGETLIWCSKDGTKIYLDVNGVIHVDAASGQDIIFNGGALKVARDTDPLSASGPMVAWALVAETAINALAPGTFTPGNQFAGAAPANPGKPGNFGTIDGGADHVKG